jgi:hypothetical protein
MHRANCARCRASRPRGSRSIIAARGSARPNTATGELSVSAEFTTDRKETVSKAGGGTTQSVISKWEGTALLVNTLVRSPGGQYTVMDRWKLSRDRQRLTVRRQVIQLHGEMEFTLVYERVPAGNPAITRPRNGRQGS